MSITTLTKSGESAMREQGLKKASEYRQAVRRVGLPFGVVYLCLDYMDFRITNPGLRYSTSGAGGRATKFHPDLRY